MKDRDLRNLLGERAAQYVRHNYTIDRVAGQYRELWMRLSLEKHSGSFDEIEDVS